MKTFGPSFILILSALLCWSIGCAERQPEPEGAGQDSGLMGNRSGGDKGTTQTPSGRTELPTIRTEAPNLWITLPKNFSVRADTTESSDILVVSRTDDPLLRDSSQVPFGMLRIIVGDSVVRVTPSDTKVAERKALIGSYPGVWRYYTGVIPGSATYYSYELSAPDFFAGVSPDSKMKGLHLHLYIAGKDTAIIGELIKAAESISTRP